MTLIDENIIPGNHGRVFGTNATKEEDLNKIARAIRALAGIKDVIIDASTFPEEFTIHTSAFVRIDDIQQVVKALGFHAIPKGLFKLF
ncbi:MAG: heavy-metal-associated domain-containing protein [Flammeovirgaceae bacterium]|nr:heavy-metal-associated domain-containing protein [Flammeovirgaceae bacterium]